VTGRLHPEDARKILGGPGKLCEAMSIDRNLNGKNLLDAEHVWLASPLTAGAGRIEKTPRIGITRSVGLLRRYLLEDERYTSRRSINKAP
jgi:3-methyladenine DNA glycosylase Mpg